MFINSLLLVPFIPSPPTSGVPVCIDKTAKKQSFCAYIYNCQNHSMNGFFFSKVDRVELLPDKDVQDGSAHQGYFYMMFNPRAGNLNVGCTSKENMQSYVQSHQDWALCRFSSAKEESTIKIDLSVCQFYSKSHNAGAGPLRRGAASTVGI